MKKIYYLLFFLIINFACLALGSWLMDGGPTSEWYNALNKAPWTPPGWVFGAAWSFIMLCFACYLTSLIAVQQTTYFWTLYVLHCALNIGWNWIFFNQRLVVLGLLVIVLLTALMSLYFFTFKKDQLKYTRALLLPYVLWLCIATSLNAYIVFNN